MRYFRSAAFKRTYQSLDPTHQKRADKTLRQLEALFAERQRPHGLGLKALKPGIWEIRTGLADRILFRWTKDAVELLVVGNHDEILRLLKQL